MGKKADVQVFRNNLAFLLPQVLEQLDAMADMCL